MLKHKGEILASLVLIALVGVTICFADAGAQKVSLKFHPTVGDKVTYETTSVSEIETKGMPGLPSAGKKQTMTQVMEQTQTVKAQKPDGNYLVELSFDKMSMQMGDAAPVPYGNLAGKVFTLEMSPAGKLLGIQGLDDLGPGMKENMENMINQMSETFVFPQRDVAVGETWQNTAESEMSLGNIGKLIQTITCDYTLLGVENVDDVSAAKISMKMKLEQKSAAGSQQMQVKCTGTGEGVFYYDYQHSRVLSSNLTTTMNMSTTMNPPPGRSGPRASFTTQQHIVTKMTMKIKK